MSENKKAKDFDSGIILKLLRFTKKYRLWFVAAVIALLFSTVAELALPIILQKSIDRNIMARWVWIDSSLEYSDLPDADEYHHSEDGRIFLLVSDLKGISSSDRVKIKAEAMMASEEWYVFPDSDIDPALLSSLHERTVLDNSFNAIPMRILKQLNGEDRKALRSDDVVRLKKRVIQYFLLLMVILVFSFVQIMTMAWTSQGVMKDIRLTMFSHIMHQSLSFLGDTPVGALVSKITSDVETINEFFTSVTISMLKDIAIMSGVIITLFILNPLLAGITLLTLPPILIGSIFFRNRARSAYRKQRHWISRVNSFLSEHVAGMEIIQIFGKEKSTGDQFNKDNEELLKASMAEMYVFAVFRPMVDLFTSVSLAVVIYTGSIMLNRQVLSLGILIAFIDLIQKFYRPVMDMSEKFSIMQSAMAGGERVFSLLEEDHRIADKGELEDERIQGEIEFRNVCFSYREGEPVLKDLSFRAKPGETIAIVGYTGAGKTTIASLATRLWDIDSGQILLDGKPLENYSLSHLRKSIQSVQQDVFLFSGSLKENITLGSEMSDEDLRKAASTVQADRFIDSLEKGYETEIQERGKNLSGGQKQLLSFARAVAHNPAVLILDEATANIDTETEKLIQKAMDKLLEGRTSLVIAHRISTIQRADRILVLSEGHLLESGTHKELISKEGLYYNLYNYQYAAGES
ncbi:MULTISPECIES: ABC transporter ATP-binding protein [unclassified Oceanispirochaeta]|uniref:ABC transporter ATP-binding protein n=1 Tax=unclassified Oceanispirochaeta TaxID=2635722 RepID=UPI000E093E3E|nr:MULTISPECIES: ABC transporter ATP-binding protein [unclassified Oceanispirochaeta]MBF9015568.1 ABC transporter ATP-binding protein [Oceanispirochaeta sp. M2]NPD73943.1 ABC transporter ATP-binding protein [Oceanispirochaeta sp. M1]RDG30254.1 ABC transporter ATP-binding protein [Oceanispirochaeta sp. M1]